MKKEHPLAYILRKRKPKDLDSDFDLICSFNYFCGKFGNNIPVEESREVWTHIKKLLANNTSNN